MNQIATNGNSDSTESANAGPIFMPPADILETGDTVVMLLDVPGADPASLDVTLDKHLLTITARVEQAAPQGYTPVHIEVGDGTYERRFVFSERMDGARIEATLKDGVLRLTVPKAADAAAKKISVKTE
jgi:HSP20 family protein